MKIFKINFLNILKRIKTYSPKSEKYKRRAWLRTLHKRMDSMPESLKREEWLGLDQPWPKIPQNR